MGMCCQVEDSNPVDLVRTQYEMGATSSLERSLQHVYLPYLVL